MPTIFSDREQAFEAKYAHDEELRFLTLARRDKLFARWAAGKLRLPDEATRALVMNVLAIPNGPQHDQTLLHYVGEFLSAGGVATSNGERTAALSDALQQASRQLAETPPDHSEIL